MRPFFLILKLVAWLCASVSVASSFEYVEVDLAGPRSAWGKAIGDLNGDGLTDLVVGGHQQIALSLWQRVSNRLGFGDAQALRGELVWYRAPDWARHTVSTAFNVRTDIETGDLDGDGQQDIVALADQGVVWFRAPDWTPRIVDERRFHDLELADLDGDGKLDIVLRNQSLFGHADGNRVEIMTRAATGNPTLTVVSVPHGEGLAVHDLTGDGVPEIVVNSVFLQRDPSGAGWLERRYADDSWQWQDVFVAAADVDRDSRVDIVLAPAEEAGETYRLSWFRAPANGHRAWREIVVAADIEAVHHFVGAADFDGDGWVDIATAQMNQGADPDEVSVYRNLGGGAEFQKQRLGVDGSHSMRIVDVDGDFDPDLFGANWYREGEDIDYPVQLWRNLHRTPGTVAWTRHVVDEARPGQALFVLTADIDQDSRVDIVSGGYWYANPGEPGGSWMRRALGPGADNAILAEDFDGDGLVDVLASGWRGYGYRPGLLDRALGRVGLKEGVYGAAGDTLVLARNLGKDGFDVIDAMEQARGDFLQGAALFTRDGQRSVALSFHKSGTALQALDVPGSPLTGTWRWRELSPESQNEAVSAADIDGDGEVELVTGTRYLDQGEVALQEIYASDQAPDRHRVTDVNGDGALDIIVGYEAPSRPGTVAWYERPAGGGPWIEHRIATLVGPMSLDAGDIDGDGDIDVVVGEHNLAAPEQARLVWMENRDGVGGSWSGHLIHTGDEHHDGARLSDIDSDGDLDVVSIGWSHGRVLIYETPGNPLS